MHDASFVRKFTAPLFPSVLLHRTSLITRLQEAITPERYQDKATARYQVVLCCAPAGYGKTTLLADFVRSTALPCCWYFLERADLDPVVFLRTLFASVRHTFPQFGDTCDSTMKTLLTQKMSYTSDMYYPLLDALCTAIATEISERFVLILSNYEEINESETQTDLVNYLLKKLPSQVTLIIESRVIPDLSFTSLVIQDTICGLDGDALRFSAQDIEELVRLQGLPPLTQAEAEHLATSFDGWITGILLGTHVGDARFRRFTQHTAERGHLPALRGKSLEEYKRNMLFTYVVDEVLKRDMATYTFLQTISILQQIEPTLCDTLLESTDTTEHLARLERQGLFLTSYKTASGLAYTCHPVIRELLSEQLRRQEPERFLMLHRKAAILWHAIHNDEQAIYHALTINAYDMAISLILDAGDQLLQHGQHETVIRWLSALPSALQENHPQLLMLQATIALDRGQLASALPLLEKAEQLVPDSGTRETQVLWAMIAVLRGKALFQSGAYAQAEALCQQVLRQVPAQEYALRAAAEMRLGMCATLQGQFTAGITYLQQALHQWDTQPSLRQTMEIHQALANTYFWIGNVLLAEHHLTQVLDTSEQLQDMQGKGNALILQGLIAQDQGRVAEAEATFLEALALARTIPHMQRVEAYALVNIGALSVEKGEYLQALKYAEEGFMLARMFGNRSLMNNALMNRALSYLFLGDPVSALLAVEHMEVPVVDQGTAGYELAWRDLTYGMIFLKQQRYCEAETCLATIEAALSTADLKREHLQAKFRLAACYIAQNRSEDGIRLLKEATSLLVAYRSATRLVQIEFQWLPVLVPVVQKHAQLAPLRTLLGMEELLQVPKKQDLLLSRQDETPTPAPTLTIYAFGEPTVLLNGQPIKRWRMPLAKELFFFLLDATHPLSKEAILTALWPEYEERTSQLFHDTVYRLRKLFGDASIIFSPAGYRLDLAALYGNHVWYDVRVFQQHQIEAEQALAVHNEADAKEAFLKMVQLYRGDYGQSFFNNWCAHRRDVLYTSHLEAYRQLAQIAWRAEDWEESARHWRQLLRLDNCLEEAHYGIMRCYMRLDKRGAALRQYQSCQRILQEELGVQPGQALQNLYQRLAAKQRVE